MYFYGTIDSPTLQIQIHFDEHRFVLHVVLSRSTRLNGSRFYCDTNESHCIAARYQLISTPPFLIIKNRFPFELLCTISPRLILWYYLFVENSVCRLLLLLIKPCIFPLRLFARRRFGKRFFPLHIQSYSKRKNKKRTSKIECFHHKMLISYKFRRDTRNTRPRFDRR